ncbi:MAG: Holliday junction ATP-dependent DNA helicase RuvA [Candidatus Moranbacteria bacterium GW2011_GWE2_35_164]|nr:MAG: Holliday junction ATP-dependent DNA helicase RuvA [Candidatus Moranbacteria bacterium GW2011_GWE2_35_164]
MIAKLTGKIEYLRDKWIIVDVAGVGYKVFLTDFTLGKIAGSKEGAFFIYTYVREDILALYGFISLEEKEMFEADPASIRAAILNNDPTILTKVSGVGKKTAERVILELQNKVADMPMGERQEIAADSEMIEVLMSMGYSAFQAREALKAIPKDIEKIEDKIKFALKEMGK